MLKAIIIDDEQHCIDRLSELLAHHQHIIEVVDEIKTVETALTVIPNIEPDIVFLDVHLNGKTGFDLLKGLKKVDFEVVFTTAYNKYAIEAFKFSAVDYLMKPIDGEELKSTVLKLKGKVSILDLSNKIEVLLSNLEKKSGDSRKIAIPTANGHSFIHVSDIIRCKSDVNYTTVFMKNDKELRVAKTLKSFEGLLNNYNFFRVHHSHLVNLNHVVKYTKGKGGIVYMSDGSEIDVSSRREDLFLNMFSTLSK